jgi:hypothetical protein
MLTETLKVGLKEEYGISSKLCDEYNAHDESHHIIPTSILIKLVNKVKNLPFYEVQDHLVERVNMCQTKEQLRMVVEDYRQFQNFLEKYEEEFHNS